MATVIMTKIIGALKVRRGVTEGIEKTEETMTDETETGHEIGIGKGIVIVTEIEIEEDLEINQEIDPGTSLDLETEMTNINEGKFYFIKTFNILKDYNF